MTEPDDDIVAPLAELTNVAPGAEATGRAMARARAALSEELESHRARWRRRIVMSSGIAAVVTVGAVIVASLFNPPRVDAAAQLAEVADVNQAYRGWVHFTSRSPGERPGDEPRLGWSHFNTVDGTFVSIREQGESRRVRMVVPRAKEERTYDSATNEIRIGTITAEVASEVTQQMQYFPLTVVAAEQARQKRGLPPAKIEQRVDGTLQRFDITIPAPAGEKSDRGPTTRPAIERATVWADPETKLMVKGEFAVAGGKSFTVTMTYGEPVIASIHDVDVPRDAKVVDERGR